MDQVKWILFTELVVLSLYVTQTGRVAAEGSNPATIPSEDINQLLDKGVIYVYTMTNMFLEDVIQRNYLTKMNGLVDLTTVKTSLDSVKTSWSEWAIYMVGFAVCLALGLVLAVVMFLACLLFPCCRCCGRCGAVNPKKSPVKGSSKCRTLGCSIALIVVAAGLVVGVVAMYATNEAFQTQLAGPLFDHIDEGLKGINDFFELTLGEINETLYIRYLETEEVVFGIIEDVPSNAIKAIDDATGAVTTLNHLSDFARQLDTLQRNLLDSEYLAAILDVEASQLQKNLSIIAADVTSALSGCSSAECTRIGAEVNSTEVRVDFGVVNVTNALFAVNVSLSSGLVGQVDDSLQQLTDVEDSINSTMSSAVTEMKTTAKNVEAELTSIIDNLNSTLKGIDMLSTIQNMVLSVKDMPMYKLGIEIAYWFLLGLACVVVAVILLDLLGLLMGCGCFKTVGYHLLMTGTAFTFIFYWLFTLLVAILFILGGPIHTEFCRNVVQNDQPASSSVLTIFDGWIDGSISSSINIRPFEIYSACQANASFYEAFDLAQFINITEVTEGSAINVKEATDKFKGVAINLPNVNITNPTLTTALNTLDAGLSESNLNFTNFYVNIEGNITNPNLLLLAKDLDSLADVNLSSYAATLRSVYNSSVLPMSADRDRLVMSLKSAETIVHLVSFSEAAVTLENADSIIRNNGTYIISAFVNSTADAIYEEIEKYVKGVAYSFEKEVARCGPLYGSLKTMFDALCVQLLYPLNGYWFGLGWCIFFLIPNIFLSVNLATAFKIGTSGNSIKHRDSEDNFPDKKA